MKNSVCVFICRSRNSHLPQIAVVLAVALNGCGGGSSDSSPTTPAQVPPSPTVVAATYTVGGTISGLNATGLVIANGADTLSVAANTARFTMGQPMARGTAYNLTLETQPSGLRCTLTNGSGTIGSANVTDVAVACMPVSYQVSTLAGSGIRGYVDGSAAFAQFWAPSRIAVDGHGNVYVCDGIRIRKITPDGMVSTFAGYGVYGPADEEASLKRFANLNAIGADKSGNVYVIDGNLVRKITPDGTVSILAGNEARGSTDGVGIKAYFDQPIHLAVDNAGNVYVAQTSSSHIRKILPDGTVSTLLGTGRERATTGHMSVNEFRTPSGLTVDGRGNVFVADDNRIRKISQDGTVSTLAGIASGIYEDGRSRGYVDGNGPDAKFNSPSGLAVDENDNIIVADSGNDRIRMITPDGTVSTVAGSETRGYGDSPTGEFADGDALTAKFDVPTGVAVDSNGAIYVADGNNRRVRKITR